MSFMINTFVPAAMLLAAATTGAAATERLSTSNRSNQVVIRVDVSDQTMTVMQAGRRLFSWPVSTGGTGYVTPVGTYQPQWFSLDHRSRKYNNTPMPFAIFYDGDYAIHATYSTSQLGQPASHGCVRLHPDNASTLYDIVFEAGRENTYIVVQD